MDHDLIIKGAHVIDPELGIDKVTAVAISDGLIVGVGDEFAAMSADQTIQAEGKYLSPGWIDMHVHSYSTLSFSDPDTIGVLHGVPTIVDAGGGGVWTYDECRRYWEGHSRTEQYAFVHHIPAGIYTGAADSLDIETENQIEVHLDEWKDLVVRNRDRIVGVKGGAHTYLGMAPINFVNMISQAVDLPGYFHIGDIRKAGRGDIVTSQMIDACSPGDIITHCYTGKWGNLVDPETGKVYPQWKVAKGRGVLLDVGFGSTNFAYEAFDSLMAQDVITDIISSDLQGVNITGPAYSLANVMSIFVNNGYVLKDVIQRVTINPAKAIGLDWKLGSLKAGYPARITLFHLEDGEWNLRDCEGVKRPITTKVVPDLCVMDKNIIQSDIQAGLRQENWSLMPLLDDSPVDDSVLDTEQREFIRLLAKKSESANWDSGRDLHGGFRDAFTEVGIDERHAANAVYDVLLESRFCVPVGWLLNGLDRETVLGRLKL